MPKILNVVCVFFSIPFFFGEQLSYFTRKGYKIHLSCSPSEKLKPYAEQHGCSSVEIFIKRNFSVFDDIKALNQLFKYIRKEKFEIVCGHTPKGGLLSMIAAFFAGVPKRVFFRHGLVYETSSGIKRFILTNAERIASLFATEVVCVSPYLIKRSINDHLTSPDKMRLLNLGSCNGIDALTRFNPSNIKREREIALREKLGLTEEMFIIGYTGRLVKDKGIIELVDAFQNIHTINPFVRLLLVGPLEERDALPEHIVDTVKAHPGIVYTGLVESDIEYYYALMDVLVLCTHREGFGTAILEASAMAKPVLTTSHTGSRDAIIDGVTGYYIEMSVTSIVDRISRYMLEPALRIKHGENGRQFMLDNFQQEIIWAEIENKIYNS